MKEEEILIDDENNSTLNQLSQMAWQTMNHIICVAIYACVDVCLLMYICLILKKKKKWTVNVIMMIMLILTAVLTSL